MGTLRRLIVTSIFVVCGFTASLAQGGDFTLDPGRVGEAYQQSIERVLAVKYGVRLESGAQAAAFEWAPVESLPPGLKLNSDGTITGVPLSHQAEPYRFRVRVTDRSMRDAEALELNFIVQMMAPRIRLVKNNAPRLVPIDPSAEQANTPAASTPAAPALGGGNGDGHVVPTAESVAARPERASRLTAAPEGQPESAEPQATPTPDQGVNQTLNVAQYVNIVEETSGGNTYPLNLAGKHVDDLAKWAMSKAGNVQSVKELGPEGEQLLKNLENQLGKINFRLRSDHESTIVVQRIAPQPADCIDMAGNKSQTGLRFIISAELVQEKGSTSLPVIGVPLAPPPTQSAALFTAGSTQVQLTSEAPIATINLKQADAEKDDQVRLLVEAVCESADTSTVARVMGRRTYDIELTNFGWESGVSPSLFLLNRQRVRTSDIQPDPVLAAQGSVTNPINSVNYSPFPGVNYLFTYKGEARDKGDTTSKILSFFKPGFGVNATLMDFNDQSIDFQNFSVPNFADKILDKDSDVQMGVGAVLTFFGNKLQMTYGGNLAVDRKKAYFGIGLSFLELIGLF